MFAPNQRTISKWRTNAMEEIRKRNQKLRRKKRANGIK
jgi:hypothetical protein